jgi:hypothetical protein
MEIPGQISVEIDNGAPPDPKSAVSGPRRLPFRRVHSVRWRSRLGLGASFAEEATQIIDRR